MDYHNLGIFSWPRIEDCGWTFLEELYWIFDQRTRRQKIHILTYAKSVLTKLQFRTISVAWKEENSRVIYGFLKFIFWRKTDWEIRMDIFGMKKSFLVWLQRIIEAWIKDYNLFERFSTNPNHPNFMSAEQINHKIDRDT